MYNKVSKIKNIRLLALSLDIFFLILSLLISYSYRLALPFESGLNEQFIYFTSMISIGCLYLMGTYDLHLDENAFLIISKQIISIIISSIVTSSLIYLTRSEVSGVLGRGVFLLGNVIFLFVSCGYKFLISSYLKKLTENWSWFAFGNSFLLERLVKDLKKNTSIGNVSIYKLSDSPNDIKNITLELEKNWSGIILATNSVLDSKLSKILFDKKMSGQQVTDLFQLYEKFWYKIPVFYLEDRWFLTIDGFSITFNKLGLRIKRLIDIFISTIVLILTFPILIITYVLIKLESSGPAFYNQIRTGKDGVNFQIYKFRSMYTDAEKNGAQWSSTNDNRITKVGKYIRQFRIDEIPQIINVFKGEMSFIGPRPERPEFNENLEKEIPYYQLRHLVQPGITGWAQILYPYGSSVEDSIEKLQYDLYYIKNYSVWLDLKIILKTIKVVFFGKGR